MGLSGGLGAVWPVPRDQRAPGLCVPVGEPGHAGVTVGLWPREAPSGWWGLSWAVATSAPGRKERVPVNVEGPSQDCAPQTRTPCEGTSARSEDAAQRPLSSTPAAALAPRGAGEPQPPQFLSALAAHSFLVADFRSSFTEL